MRTWIVCFFVILSLYPPYSVADIFYQTVVYKCNRAQDYLEVQILGTYDEELSAEHSIGDTFEPWNLAKTDRDGLIVGSEIVKRSCKLKDGIYDVEMEADPCNRNPQGMGGAEMMALARVKKDGKQVAFTHLGTCGGLGKVTSSLRVQSGSKYKIGVTEDYGLDETVHCFVTTDRKTPIRLRFSYFNPNKGAFVKYEKGNEPITVRLMEDKNIRDNAKRIGERRESWQEQFGNRIGGMYEILGSASHGMKLKYYRPDGKIFDFAYDYDSSTGRGCTWEQNTK